MFNCIKGLSLLCLVLLFSACEKDKNKDTNTPAPVANAKPTARLSASNFEPREGSIFILDVSQSFDPDGDTLSFTVEQRSGTTAQRSAFNGSEMTVTVPQISADEAAVFRVTANDGTATDTADVTVTFINNDPPVARLSASTHEPREKSDFTLDASASFDDETVNLTYSFEQVSGPTVDAIDVNGAVATITAPEVSSDTAAVFRVTVGDGEETDDATIDITFTNIFRAPRFGGSATNVETLMIGQNVKYLMILPSSFIAANETHRVFLSDDPDTQNVDQKITHVVTLFDGNATTVVSGNTVLQADIPYNTEFRILPFPGMFGDDIAYIGFVPDTDEVFLLVISYDAATDTYTYSERGRFTQDITDINYSRENRPSLDYPWQPRPATSTPDFPTVPLLVLGQSTGGIFLAAPVFEAMGSDGSGNVIYHMTDIEILSEEVSGGPYVDIFHILGNFAREDADDFGGIFSREYEYFNHINLTTLTDSSSSIRCPVNPRFCLDPSTLQLERRSLTYMPSFSRPGLELSGPTYQFYTDGLLQGPHSYFTPYFDNGGIPGSTPTLVGYKVGEWDEGHPVDGVGFGGNVFVSTPEMPELVVLVNSPTDASKFDVEYLEIGFGAETLIGLPTNKILISFPENGEIRTYKIEN